MGVMKKGFKKEEGKERKGNRGQSSGRVKQGRKGGMGKETENGKD
jgi:hypothetical protein